MKDHGRSHDGRGRHRRLGSAETKRWHDVAETKDWLQTPESGRAVTASNRSQTQRTAPAKPNPSGQPPKCPPWLDPGEYAALLELRGRL